MDGETVSGGVDSFLSLPEGKTGSQFPHGQEEKELFEQVANDSSGTELEPTREALKLRGNSLPPLHEIDDSKKSSR
eukprot:1376836-Amorphochlora_amoeboformis.AAC.3